MKVKWEAGKNKTYSSSMSFIEVFKQFEKYDNNFDLFTFSLAQTSLHFATLYFPFLHLKK